jgi:hypothetical protein
MKFIIIVITLALAVPGLMGCSKYKLIDKEKEQADKVQELEEKVKELAEKSEEKTKVVVVKDRSSGDAGTSAAAAGSKPRGWVRLYDDKGFTDRQLTVGFGQNVGNFHNISSDDGKSGFNDKASAVKFSVPSGWKAVLYENSNYAKRGYPLKGKGAIADLGYFGDKASSIRWERD